MYQRRPFYFAPPRTENCIIFVGRTSRRNTQKENNIKRANENKKKTKRRERKRWWQTRWKCNKMFIFDEHSLVAYTSNERASEVDTTTTMTTKWTTKNQPSSNLWHENIPKIEETDDVDVHVKQQKAEKVSERTNAKNRNIFLKKCEENPILISLDFD